MRGARRWRFQARPLLGLATMAWCATATAADIIKANNTDALNVTTSWSGGAVPGSGDVAVWDSTVTGANTAALGGGLTWGGIKLTNPGGNVAITGGDTLTLGSSGVDLSGSTANLSLGTPVALSANQVWRAATGRTITATGVISGTAGLEIGVAGNLTAATTNTFLTTSAQNLFSNRSLSDLTGSAGQLSGAWISNAPQSATGYLLNNNGSTANFWLEIVQGADTKGVQVTLEQSGSDITARSTAAKYQPNSTTLPFDFNAAGTTIPIATSSGGDGYGVASTTLYFGSDTNGSVLLSGVNTYSGATTVTRGILTAGTASVAGVGGAFGLNSAVTMANALFTGLDLAGFNTSIGSLAGGGGTGGTVALGAATLTVGGNDSSTSYAGVMSGTGGLVKVGTGNQTLTGANTFSGGTTIAAGTLTITNSSGLGTGSVTLGSAATGSAAASLTLSGGVTFARAITVSNQGSGPVTLAGTNAAAIDRFSGTLTLNRDVTLSGSSTDRTDFSGGISGTGNVTISGTNRVLFLTAANTYAGTTTILNGSRLQLSDGTATATSFLPDNQTVTVNSGGFLNIAKGGNTEAIGGLAGAGTVQAFFSSNTLSLGGGDQTASFGGVLQQTSGTLSLTKTGTGTQTLAGNNTYTGTTTVSGGTLVVGNGAGSGAIGSGAVTVDSGATFTINRGGFGQVWANNFSGTGTLRILGGQDPQFSGNNSNFTGPIIIDGADAQFRTRSANAWSGQSVVTITNGGMASAFNYEGSDDIKIGSLWGNGTVRLGATGFDRDLYLGGNNLDATFTGTIVNDAGGSGSVIKNGTGTQTLSGASSYSGGTTINGGTLVAANNTALGGGGVTIASGATLRIASGTTISNTLSFAGGGLQRVSNQSLGTVADIVAGTSASAVTLEPIAAWSARVNGTTFSDVLDLTNTAGTIQILQVSYDPSILGGTPTSDLALGWNTNGSWVNAIAGNTGSAGGSALTNQSGSFTSLGILPTAAFLGSWGRDTTANTVWAVVDHNSDFAAIAVPEPGVLGLVGVGLVGCLGLAVRRLRR